MWNRKNHKGNKLKDKIIINVTLIWFEGSGKTIPLNSILDFVQYKILRWEMQLFGTDLLKT